MPSLGFLVFVSVFFFFFFFFSNFLHSVFMWKDRHLWLHLNFSCYSDMNYQFLNQYNWCLWHYFLLLLEEIQFLSGGFLFLAMAKSSCVKRCHFVATSIHIVVLPPIFVFLIFFLFLFTMPLQFVFTVINFLYSFYYIFKTMYRCIYVNFEYWNVLFFTFLNISSLCHLAGVRPYPLS